MKRVLVIGDVMVDEYLHVTTERSAQEADIPVYDLVRTESRLGGAGNVAANIKALDDDIHVTLSCIADGDARSLIISNGLDTYCAYGSPIKKTRLINRDIIVTRLDNKKLCDEARVSMLEEMYTTSALDLNDFDAIVISDYDKGTITKSIVEKIMKSSATIIVDSKRKDLSIFKGANFLNINFDEYSTQCSNKIYRQTVEELFDHVIVTRGKDSTYLLQYESVAGDRSKYSYLLHKEEFPVDVTETIDVTGCGDTHTAAFTIGLLRDKDDVRNAVRYANRCASIAVTKQGTAKVTKWDFLNTSQD